eukprot:540210-Pyramimonas_sp.AAC.1
MPSGKRSKGHSPAPSALGFGRWRRHKCSGIGVDAKPRQDELGKTMPSALGIGPEEERAVTLPLAALSRAPQQAGRPSPPPSPQTMRSVEERVSLTLADLSP